MDQAVDAAQEDPEAPTFRVLPTRQGKEGRPLQTILDGTYRSIRLIGNTLEYLREIAEGTERQERYRLIQFKVAGLRKEITRLKGELQAL